MASVVDDNGANLVDAFPHLSFEDQGGMQNEVERVEEVCTICLDDIVLQETALIKGCEHAYCMTCILRWVTYSNIPACPQCKHPFEYLGIYRTLDGCIQDYMVEESVWLLLRAPWFEPLIVEEYALGESHFLHLYEYEDVDVEEDLDELHFSRSLSNLRIGNRRWGGAVESPNFHGGRQEARPVTINIQDSDAESSREPRKRETSQGQDKTGRRAKRNLKREAADRAAAAKHQQRLVRLGRTTVKAKSGTGIENDEAGSRLEGSCS